ncbi:hypothetical protein [Thomasclavelia cocleata]|jgi:hypothetical protein|uniref:hypothetical protein n=1 Tax=Thomasclavelia cocleata TaxID=69824 RepID=UPI00272E37AC|nr:hypothetical protein [Thomasclavelia cocleata]
MEDNVAYQMALDYVSKISNFDPSEIRLIVSTRISNDNINDVENFEHIFQNLNNLLYYKIRNQHCIELIDYIEDDDNDNMDS